MSDFDSQTAAFAAEIELELQDSDLIFPTVLELSMRIKHAADDPDSSLEQLAALIRIEPLLAARVVRMANSVAFNPQGRTITSVPDAVQRIGVQNVRILALVVAIEQLAQEYRSDALRQLAIEVWQHSIDVAAWAYAIAHHLKLGEPDTALFAGLLADIGQLYLIARVGRYPAIATDARRFAELVGHWQAPLTQAILKTLGLPPGILDALDSESPYGGSWPPRALDEVIFIAGLAADSDNPFDPVRGEVRRKLLEIAKFNLDAEKFDQLLAAAELERNEMLAVLEP